MIFKRNYAANMTPDVSLFHSDVVEENRANMEENNNFTQPRRSNHILK